MRSYYFSFRKYFSPLALLPAFLLPAISCSGPSATEQSAEVEKKAGFREIPGWVGIFQDTLPCPDCPGLLTWLEIYPEGRYKRISTRIGEADVFAHTQSSSGRWTFDRKNNLISLDSVPEQRWLAFTPEGDSVLVACDTKGIPLAGGRWKIRRRTGGDGLK